MAAPSDKTTPPPAEDISVSESAPTPAEEEDINSKKVTLADLSAKGSTLYAHKSYEEACEVFSEASNLQAEINGETAPENAEILFHYGRSLFKVGQSKSNVLGGPAVVDKKPASSAKAQGDKAAPKAPKPAGGAALKDGESKDGPDAKKPLFQFTGDENFDDSDDDDAAADGDEDEQDEEEDDLSIAFEILDLARVCYVKRLEQLDQEEQDEPGKGKEVAQESSLRRHIKERLADTHDALAEISLENEKYPNAIEDGRTSLQYKLGLYPEDSEIIAEAHFKLSLALEFASVTTSSGPGAATEDMDQGLRDEAIKEMELALKSFRLKMQNKEVELATMASPEDNELARKAIHEMKEVIADMDQRLVDLRAGPIDTKGLLGQDSNPLGGLFGNALAGESASETQARVDEAKKTATDLSGLVRKKKPAADPAGGDAAQNGKRKASGETGGESPKKAKLEDE